MSSLNPLETPVESGAQGQRKGKLCMWVGAGLACKGLFGNVFLKLS